MNMRLVRALSWVLIGALMTIVCWGLAYGMEVIAPDKPSFLVYYFIGPQGDRIDLFSKTTDECKALSDQALRALYTYRDGDTTHKPGQTVEGCYIINESFVYLIYADGDRGKLQLRLFSPAV